MAVEFRPAKLEFKHVRNLQQLTGSVTFQRKVRVAEIALRGFFLDFDSSDHHMNVLEVTTNFGGTEGEIVHFRVRCQYADKNSDDFFSGHVDVLVIADLMDA